MMPAIPVDILPIPFIGDGPSAGIGNAASDSYWGQKETITGSVIVQHVRAPAYPYAPYVQELAGPVYYPGAQVRPVTTGMAQQALPTALQSAYQDDITPIGSAPDLTQQDIALGAPGVPTGIPFIGRA